MLRPSGFLSLSISLKSLTPSLLAACMMIQVYFLAASFFPPALRSSSLRVYSYYPPCTQEDVLSKSLFMIPFMIQATCSQVDPIFFVFVICRGNTNPCCEISVVLSMCKTDTFENRDGTFVKWIRESYLY